MKNFTKRGGHGNDGGRKKESERKRRNETDKTERANRGKNKKLHLERELQHQRVLSPQSWQFHSTAKIQG